MKSTYLMPSAFGPSAATALIDQMQCRPTAAIEAISRRGLVAEHLGRADRVSCDVLRVGVAFGVVEHR